jgi:hypothetical protein
MDGQKKTGLQGGGELSGIVDLTGTELTCTSLPKILEVLPFMLLGQFVFEIVQGIALPQTR